MIDPCDSFQEDLRPKVDALAAIRQNMAENLNEQGAAAHPRYI